MLLIIKNDEDECGFKFNSIVLLSFYKYLIISIFLNLGFTTPKTTPTRIFNIKTVPLEKKNFYFNFENEINIMNLW